MSATAVSRAPQYDLVTHWAFDAPLDTVWEAVVDADAWPLWWRAVERVITFDRGDAAGLGCRRAYTWKGALPYRVRFESRVTRVERPRVIEAIVAGELEGTGRCEFARCDGLTRVLYRWRVRTTRPWMNLIAPVAKPLFRWNHHAIMRTGARGLARHLGGVPARPVARG